ncbi:MAG: hypothetical protein ABH884_01085 [Candidatus Komeilibacteria bacterium]
MKKSDGNGIVSTEASNDNNTKEVECLSCREIVKVELIPYGGGHIASCPKCNKLAYNGK